MIAAEKKESQFPEVDIDGFKEKKKVLFIVPDDSEGRNKPRELMFLHQFYRILSHTHTTHLPIKIILNNFQDLLFINGFDKMLRTAKAPSAQISFVATSPTISRIPNIYFPNMEAFQEIYYKKASDESIEEYLDEKTEGMPIYTQETDRDDSSRLLQHASAQYIKELELGTLLIINKDRITHVTKNTNPASHHNYARTGFANTNPEEITRPISTDKICSRHRTKAELAAFLGVPEGDIPIEVMRIISTMPTP